MKAFKIIIIYTIIGVVVSSSLLYYLNNKFDRSYSTDSISNAKFLNKKITVPTDTKFLDIIENNKYLTYLSNGKIIIKNLSDNSLYKQIKEASPICYIKPIEVSHKILYIVENQNNFNLKIYDINNNESVNGIKNDKIERKINSQIQSVYFSSLTNLIYITISTDKISKVYSVDANNSLKLVDSKKQIVNNDTLVLREIPEKLQVKGENNYIYENSDGNIFIGNELFENKNQTKNFALLGADKDDNIYILNKENSSIYTVRYDFFIKKIVSETKIDNIKYKKSMKNNGEIYLIYTDSIYDVINNKSFKIDQSEVIKVKSDLIVYKNSNTEISIKKLE
jgi:hypothetical protein